MYPGEQNAIKNCVDCNWGLATLPGEVDVRFIEHFSLFDRDPGEPNAMKNCTHCNEELATLSSEVDVQFIALISFFDRTHCRIGGPKVGRLT